MPFAQEICSILLRSLHFDSSLPVVFHLRRYQESLDVNGSILYIYVPTMWRYGDIDRLCRCKMNDF